MRVAVLGPLSPGDLSAYLFPADAAASESLSGYGTAVNPLVSGLVDAGHEVVGITHRRGFGAAQFRGERLEVHQVKSRSSAPLQALDGFAAERKAMAAVLRKAAPDVVHAHWSYEWALTAVGGAAPVVVTVHDAPLSVLARDATPYRWLRTLLAYRVRVEANGALFTAVSPYLARAWRRQMLFPAALEVIPNVVVPIGVPDHRSQKPSIIEVADASRLKNVRVLLEAMSRVQAVIPDACLEVYGPGLDSGSALARRARALGLSETVRFHGPVSAREVRAAMRDAWVHCHTSLEESAGLTLVEALSCGTPVIAGARSGAVPETLHGLPSGMLVDVRSPDAVADAIVTLLSDPKRRARAEEEGPLRAASYAPEAVVGAYQAAYEAAIDVRSRARGGGRGKP